jgi:hypothetical protein
MHSCMHACCLLFGVHRIVCSAGCMHAGPTPEHHGEWRWEKVIRILTWWQDGHVRVNSTKIVGNWPRQNVCNYRCDIVDEVDDRLTTSAARPSVDTDSADGPTERTAGRTQGRSTMKKCE